MKNKINKTQVFLTSLLSALAWAWYNPRIDNPIRDFIDKIKERGVANKK